MNRAGVCLLVSARRAVHGSEWRLISLAMQIRFAILLRGFLEAMLTDTPFFPHRAMV